MSEVFVRIRLRAVPEGGYLATSEALPGLVAQGRTVGETMEIAQDVARKLIEFHQEHGEPLPALLSDGIPWRKLLGLWASRTVRQRANRSVWCTFNLRVTSQSRRGV